MLTYLKRAAMEHSGDIPILHCSRRGTLTAMGHDGRYRFVEKRPEYIARVELRADAAIAKILGVKLTEHLQTLRERNVPKDHIDEIRWWWGCVDASTQGRILLRAAFHANPKLVPGEGKYR